MAKYRFKNGQWIDLETGLPGEPKSVPWTDGPARPHLVSDYEAYECPVTGKMIEGRAAHRENLKRTGCRLFEPGEREQYIKNESRRREETAERISSQYAQIISEKLG